jgi:anaerobic ribonucleoside-triphosphate reductase activating protein
MTCNTHFVRIQRRHAPVTVLGPGRRAVIWVQGCTLGCVGCLIPESWHKHAGERVSLQDLAKWVLSQPEIEGITLSGGEPMQQALELLRLIDLLRGVRDLGVVCYTGYTVDHIREKGTEDQKALVERVDLLIDGPYVQRLHIPLLWRGSSNQRLIPISSRYLSSIPGGAAGTDHCAGLELFVEDDGGFSFAGVPPEAGFRDRFEQLMQERGVIVTPGKQGIQK